MDAEHIISQVQRELDAEVLHQNRKMRLFFDTRKISKQDLTKELDKADVEAGSTDRKTSWHGEVMEVDWPAHNLAKIDQITQTVTETRPDGSTTTTTTTSTRQPSMSVMDRIRAKALEARAVAPNAIKEFESDLDSILAEKAIIEQKRKEAVSPHQQAIADVKGELGDLKSAIDILSNGTPS